MASICVNVRCLQGLACVRGMEERFSCHGRFAEHGQSRLSSPNPFQGSDQHPFGNVKIALSGYGIYSRLFPEI